MQTYSLVKQTQQKMTSEIWYIHLDSYQCTHGCKISLISTMCHLCEHPDPSGCDGNSFWVCPMKSFFSIFCTIMHALKIVQHILPYLIETIVMHSKLGIRYSSIQTHYATINVFLNNCIFLLFGQYSQKKQITLCSEGTSIFKSKIAYSPWNYLRHQL